MSTNKFDGAAARTFAAVAGAGTSREASRPRQAKERSSRGPQGIGRRNAREATANETATPDRSGELSYERPGSPQLKTRSAGGERP